MIILDEAEIINLAIQPKNQKQGFAKKLLEKFAKRVILIGVKKIFLEVSVRNDKAKKLYNSLGFEKIGNRKNYYKTKNGSVDAENHFISPKTLLNNMSKVF